MKILFIGNKRSSSIARFLEECALKHIEVERCVQKDMVLSNEESIFKLRDSSGKDLEDYDVYVFRGVNKFAKYYATVAEHLLEIGKYIYEEKTITHPTHDDKIAPLISPTIPTINSKLYFRKPENIETGIPYPAILKKIDSSKGEGVRLVRDTEELWTIAEQLGFPVIVQQYVKIKSDYRVMVIGGRILGIMERFNTEEDFLTTRIGEGSRKADLPKEALEIAIRAAEACGISAAGVDMLEKDGKYYCIEINIWPQFKTFEKYTEINAAGAIIDHIVKEYEDAKS